MNYCTTRRWYETNELLYNEKMVWNESLTAVLLFEGSISACHSCAGAVVGREAQRSSRQIVWRKSLRGEQTSLKWGQNEEIAKKKWRRDVRCENVWQKNSCYNLIVIRHQSQSCRPRMLLLQPCRSLWLMRGYIAGPLFWGHLRSYNVQGKEL